MTMGLHKTDNWGAFEQPLLRWTSHNYYIFWVCFCSLTCPVRNAHAPFCHLFSLRLYCILPHYLINGTVYRKKKLLSTKCVFWFSLQILSDTFLILKKWSEIWSKIYVGPRVQHPLFLSNFNETWNYSTVFSKNTHISNFMKIRPVGELFHAERQTDRHDEANSRPSQFCERAVKQFVIRGTLSSAICYSFDKAAVGQNNLHFTPWPTLDVRDIKVLTKLKNVALYRSSIPRRHIASLQSSLIPDPSILSNFLSHHYRLAFWRWTIL
jgi:hypothetical protein